jgi:hypothetical protein
VLFLGQEVWFFIWSRVWSGDGCVQGEREGNALEAGTGAFDGGIARWAGKLVQGEGSGLGRRGNAFDRAGSGGHGLVSGKGCAGNACWIRTLRWYGCGEEWGPKMCDGVKAWVERLLFQITNWPKVWRLMNFYGELSRHVGGEVLNDVVGEAWEL